MIPPRWKKVLRDLRLNRTRTVLALVALSIGTFGVGADLSAYSILRREMGVNFGGTHPPSVIVHVEGAGATREMASEVEHLPGVAKAEARGLIEARVLFGPDEWRRILLFAIDDFHNLKVSTFTLEKGEWPPCDGEILIERSAIPFLHTSMGDTIVVQTPNGPRRELRTTGVVHDPAQSPGWMDGIGYGYLTPATLALLGEAPALNELRIIVAKGADPAEVGARARQLVEGRGAVVSFINARQAAQHPHADQMQSLLFLFGAFGALSLVLGGVLSAAVIATLLRQQVRQIGAMKAVGATSWQIAGLYAGAVLLLAVAGLALGVPASALAGKAYARFVAGVLNFNLTSSAIPGWVFLVQLISGLAAPLATAAEPVLRGSSITVLDAIGDHGVGESTFRPGFFDALASRLTWLGRSTQLSLRNTFRRKGRLALTLGILAVGGATFMSAINVSVSWHNTVDSLFESRRYDLQVIFSRPYSAARVQEVVGGVAGVKAVETWGGAWAFRRYDGSTGEGFRLRVTAVPPETQMIDYPLIEGRWLRPDDTNAVVINHELLRDREANIKVGDLVPLDLDGKASTWRVVGAVRELGVRRRGQNIPASAYVSRDYFESVTGVRDRTANLVLSASERGEEPLRELTRRIERALDLAGLKRTIVQPSTDRKKELLDHLVVIRDFLLAIASLVAVVGGLALASAMSMNVMERTRELGVLRATGASTHTVVRIVVVEGVVLAGLSWVLAVGLAVPSSLVIGNFAGRVFVHANLDNTFSPAAAAGWLLLVLLIGAVASVLPALVSTRTPVAQALQYE